MSAPRPLSRRIFVIGAASAAAAALLAACGNETAPTVPAPVATLVPTAAAGSPTTAAVAATTAPAPTTVAAAATTGTTGTTGTMPTTAPTMAAATNGKTIPELRVGVAGLPDTMDPLEPSSNVFNRVNYSCFDYLVRLEGGSSGKLVPMLALDWKRTDDKMLEMTLRQNVTFQDGSPFTADDVVYTFTRIITNKDSKLGQANPTYFPLASVEKLDTYRVRFVGSQVDPIMEKRFATPGAQIVPAKYHAMIGTEAFRTKPLGTGPYKLVEFIKDDRMTFEAYKAYWGGAPAAAKVTFKLIPETATRLAAVSNGEIELATNVPPDQLLPLSMKKNLVVKGKPLTNVHMLYYNAKTKPFDRPEIRQAANLAIDRKTLIDALWLGNAVQTRGLQFEGEDLYNAARPLTEFNPDKAKQLLTQGGYAGETITYVAASPNYYTNEREAGEAIIDMWKKVGINGKLSLVELSQKAKAYTTAHASTISATSFIGDQEGYLWQPLGPDGSQQKNGYWPAPAAFNDLGQQVRSTLDRQKRYDAYQKMLDIFEQDAPGTVLYQPKENYAMQTNIEWEPYTYYYMDLRSTNFRIK